MEKNLVFVAPATWCQYLTNINQNPNKKEVHLQSGGGAKIESIPHLARCPPPALHCIPTAMISAQCVCVCVCVFMCVCVCAERPLQLCVFCLGMLSECSALQYHLNTPLIASQPKSGSERRRRNASPSFQHCIKNQINRLHQKAGMNCNV